MKIFNVPDVIHFAIRVEEDGEVFYREAAEILENKDVKELFLDLADEEVKHKATFNEMLSGKEVIAPPETYNGEYLEYLHNYIDNRIVFTKKAFDSVTSGIKDAASAITFAMQREIDSILYYHEVKQLLNKNAGSIIDRIIAEERKHFGRLSEMRQKYL